VSIICTVRIPIGIAELKRIEEENAEVMETIGPSVFKHMTHHRRITTDTEVIDIDEFPDRAAYDALVAEAGDAIARFSELTGAVDTVWEIEHEFDFAKMRQEHAQ
jgi:hypothetical protein